MRTKENLKQNKAITLVALVITIIILLILATIIIVELKNTNLFSKTIEAKNKYKQASEEENNTLDDYANKINLISGIDFADSKVDKENKTPKVESKDITLKQEVIYKPKIADGGVNPTVNTTYFYRKSNVDADYFNENTRWEVLKIDKENNQIEITTMEPTDGTVYLYDKTGWSNAENYINKLCQYFFSKKDVSKEVRNLNITDREDYINAQITTSKDFWLSSIYEFPIERQTGWGSSYGGWAIAVTDKTNFFPEKVGDTKLNGESFWGQKGWYWLHYKNSYPSDYGSSYCYSIRPVVTIPISNILKIENNMVYIK